MRRGYALRYPDGLQPWDSVTFAESRLQKLRGLSFRAKDLATGAMAFTDTNRVLWALPPKGTALLALDPEGTLLSVSDCPKRILASMPAGTQTVIAAPRGSISDLCVGDRLCLAAVEGRKAGAGERVVLVALFALALLLLYLAGSAVGLLFDDVKVEASHSPALSQAQQQAAPAIPVSELDYARNDGTAGDTGSIACPAGWSAAEQPGLLAATRDGDGSPTLLIEPSEALPIGLAESEGAVSASSAAGTFYELAEDDEAAVYILASTDPVSATITKNNGMDAFNEGVSMLARFERQ